MCQQCEGFDEDDDIEALAAAFVLRQGKTASPKPVPQTHALLNHKAAQVAEAKKAAR
ncbi:hypothetical protein [Devosia sp. Root685]|uniref:hypothetical protein n=1 Tax=Devosia sp. Root685 TaxID=1736587 RepID=UPI000A7EA57A|nr:hypothetical protein [Devosia sp. Root685]